MPKPAFMDPVKKPEKKKRRDYRLADGTKVPGVTTILGVIAKPQLIRWANRLGLEGIDSSTYVDSLAVIGTLAHKFIEDHLAGKAIVAEAYPEASVEQFDKATNSFLKYLEWEKGHKIQLVASELELVSERFQFGGGIDALMIVDGDLAIVDFKTAKAIYDDHLFQVAAYATLAEEAGHTIEQIRILQIGRTPDEGFTEKVVQRAEFGKYWDVFAAARELYLAKRKIGGGW